jgi:hypothetical protein
MTTAMPARRPAPAACGVAALALLAAATAPLPAAAQDGVQLRGVVGGGLFSVLEEDDAAALGRAELRFENVVEPAPWLVPFLGAEATSDGAFYGYGGVLFDIPLSERVYFAPNAAVGFFEEGDGRDLGHAVEFRTGIEVGYTFDGGVGLGVAFHHISNASLDEDNPGVETLTLNVSFPLN